MRRSFKELLGSAASSNSKELMKKARIANRLAKVAHGRDKRTAYAVKRNALQTLIEKMPDRIDVSKDFNLDDFLIVRLQNEGLGLHFPSEHLPKRQSETFD